MFTPASLKINEPDPRIAAWYPIWARNRAMIEGERTVKAAGRAYLPQDKGFDDIQHRNMIIRTPFTPGASRTHEGLMGLIFRKPATIKAPDGVADILATITADGFTIDDLADDVISELLITNFVGMLTDYQAAPPGISVAKAIEMGAAPQIALYQAESILGIELGKVNFRQRVTRVRLLEDEDTVRELRLDDGVYTQIVHRNNAGQWNAEDPITPTKNGQTIDEIPFSLVTSNRKYLPAKARLENVCLINAQHYLASSNLAQADYWASNPTPYLFGAKIDNLTLAPGTFLHSETKASDVRVGMLEYTGTTMDQLDKRKTDLAEDMAKYGSRILTPEKASVEAAQTISIKTASENATIAATVKLALRMGINDQLKWVSWWLDLDEDEIAYDLNTDYGLEKLTAQERAQLVAEWQADVYSYDTLIDQFIAGDALPETFDRDVDREKVAQEIADRPPVDVIPVTADNEEDASE